MTARFTILVGDTREQLARVDAHSVHAVITSPPYYSLRDYGFTGQIGLEPIFTCWGWAGYLTETLANDAMDIDEFLCGICHTCVMTGVFREVRRVLHPSGTVWINYGDRYNSYPHNQKHGAMHAHANYPKLGGGLIDTTRKNKELLFMPTIVALALQADGWLVFSDVIWWKGAGDDGKGNAKPESVQHRPIATYEHVFMLAKAERGTYYDADAVRTPYKEASLQRFKAGRTELKSGHHQPGAQRRPDTVHGAVNVGALLRNVWTIPAGSFVGDHTATFPLDLPDRIVKAATSARGACPSCLAPWFRVTATGKAVNGEQYRGSAVKDYASSGAEDPSEAKRSILRSMVERVTRGWLPSCSCVGGRSISRREAKAMSDVELRDAAKLARATQPLIACTVLDVFAGMMTTGVAALKNGRRFIGIEGSEKIAADGRARLQAETQQFVMEGLA